MRIAIDLQGLQSEGSKTRGIGRYSEEIVLSLINENPYNDYIIVLNGILPDINDTLKIELCQIMLSTLNGMHLPHLIIYHKIKLGLI